MNTKKYLLASVSAFIVMFPLGWVGHELLMPMLFDSDPMESIHRSEPMILGVMAAFLIIALIMAYIYPKGVEGDNIYGNGLRFGALIGVLISLPISLILYSVIDGLSMSHVITETIWHIIEQGAGGVVIAYIYGSKIGS